MFSDPIFLSRKLRTKRAVTNYIGAWSDGQRETMIKQSPYLFKMKNQKYWHCKTVKCCLDTKLWKWKRSQVTKWRGSNESSSYVSTLTFDIWSDVLLNLTWKWSDIWKDFPICFLIYHELSAKDTRLKILVKENRSHESHFLHEHIWEVLKTKS